MGSIPIVVAKQVVCTSSLHLWSSSRHTGSEYRYLR
ncbi:hypothetical protein BRC2024_OFSGVTRC_CDS_0107 [Acinetobacter phage vB_AbaM_Rocket]